MKKAIYVVLFTLPWFISGILFSSHFSYYEMIEKPFFALPKWAFGPVWTILYVLISISITILVFHNYLKYEKDYKKALLLNYIFNQLYLFFFFTLQNPFLGFVDCVLIFITALFLYYETKELNKVASKFLLPYVFFNIYAIVLSLSIYLMNL